MQQVGDRSIGVIRVLGGATLSDHDLPLDQRTEPPVHACPGDAFDRQVTTGRLPVRFDFERTTLELKDDERLDLLVGYCGLCRQAILLVGAMENYS